MMNKPPYDYAWARRKLAPPEYSPSAEDGKLPVTSMMGMLVPAKRYKTVIDPRAVPEDDPPAPFHSSLYAPQAGGHPPAHGQSNLTYPWPVPTNGNASWNPTACIGSIDLVHSPTLTAGEIIPSVGGTPMSSAQTQKATYASHMPQTQPLPPQSSPSYPQLKVTNPTESKSQMPTQQILPCFEEASSQTPSTHPAPPLPTAQEPLQQSQKSSSDAEMEMEVLPASVRATLSAWFVQRGTRDQPRCMLYDTGASYIHQNPAGQPAAYRYKDGTLLTVKVYKLSRFPPHWGPNGRYIAVAFGLPSGPQIIMRSLAGSTSKLSNAIPFRIWLGIRARNAEGWDEENSVNKIYGDPSLPKTSKHHSNERLTDIPIIPFDSLAEVNLPVPQDNKQAAAAPEERRLTTIQRSISQASLSAPSNANAQLDSKTRDDGDTQPDGASISHDATNIPRSPSSLLLVPETDKYYRELPEEVRTLVTQWQIQRGSVAALPCTLSYQNCAKTFWNKSAQPNHFYHSNGDRLTVKLCKIGGDLEGRSGKRLLIAEGRHLAPCPIFYKSVGSIFGDSNAVYYQIWRGTRGAGQHGFEETSSIIKVSDDVLQKYGTDFLKDWRSPEEKRAMLTSTATIPAESANRAISLPSESSSPQPATEAPNEEPAQDLPPHLYSLLAEWRQARSPASLKSVTFKNGNWKLTYHNTKGEAYSFYRNNRPLEIGIYRIKGIPGSMHSDRVLVASGRQLQPCIIAHDGPYGVHSGARRYTIFEGMQASRSDGFEAQPSIIKATTAAAIELGLISAPQKQALKPPKIHKSITVRPTRTPAITRTRPPQPQSTPSEDDLPPTCQKLIDTWLRAHPRKTLADLPCLTSTTPYGLKTTNTGVEWEHASGQSLTAETYTVPGVQNRGITVVTGRTVGPFIVSQSVPGKVTLNSGAKIWLGTKGDKHGFESAPSVFKYYTDGKASNNNAMKTATAPRGIQASTPATKRRRASSPDALQQILTMKFPASANPNPTTSPALPISTLRPHLSTNLVLLFYAPTRPTPRARLFHTCNTSQKLFAQAIAGEVFPPSSTSAPSSRVLSVRLGGTTPRNSRIVLAEDDEDDFDTLVDAIARTGWFTEAKDEVKGSGSVEVRAMLK